MMDRGQTRLIPMLILQNRLKLRSLDLGVERLLISRNSAGVVYDDRDPENQIARRLRLEIKDVFKMVEWPECLPYIEKLKVRGLDINVLVGGDECDLIDLRALRQLTLESSCMPVAALTELGSAQLSRLQSLHIRQEGVNAGFLASLETFLSGLPPLTSLIVLLEGEVDLPAFDLRRMLQGHRMSLRVLAMDLRQRNRGLLREHQTAWKISYTCEILRLCRELVELGIPILWDAYIVPTSNYRRFVSDIQNVRNSVLYILTMFTGKEYQILVAKTTYPQCSQSTRNQYTCYFHDDRCGHQRTRVILFRKFQEFRRQGAGIADSRICAYRSR